MADQTQVDILRKNIADWNMWRKENPEIRPKLSEAYLREARLSRADLREANLSRADLSETDLREADLSRADLREARLSRADLREADLSRADLREARLDRADLREANLSRADLSRANLLRTNLLRTNLREAYFRGANLKEANLKEANLKEANLKEANFREASLSGADLREASLSGADLSGADLRETRLNRADLREANLSRARMMETIFGECNLQMVKGLEEVEHLGPSTVGINTIYKSKGNIPEVFLRGTGADDTFIEYMRSLTAKPIEYYTCFISYSSKDEDFAQRLYTDLQSHGIRCWFAPHSLKPGDYIRKSIDEAIRLYDKLILLLSESSVQSTWVSFEVEAAMDKEHEEKPPVLFPLRLDEAVMESTTTWARHLKRTRHIGDFTFWKDFDAYQKGLQQLLDDLKNKSTKK